jgi:phosphoglycolate phosphatase-like HAD superfamily hydrolase
MIEQQPIRAVFFDVDGTLLDTTEFIYGGFDHTLAAHGHPVVERAGYARVMGKPLDVCYAELAPGCEPVLLCETHRIWQAGNLHLSVPFSETVDVLRTLSEAGLRLAAITSRSRRTSVHTIEQAGLAGYLDLILSAEDATAIKPDPAPLLLALEHLDVSPAATLMVGDTDADILAGRAAGVRTVGVTYGFHGAEILRHAPDITIDTLGELIPICLPTFR